MDHGRPSSHVQKNIQIKMQDYFFKGYSARKTSELLKLNRKTTQKYFKKLSEDYRNVVHSDPDFEKRVQENRMMAEITLENVSDELLLLLAKYKPMLENLPLTNKTLNLHKFLSSIIIQTNSKLVDVQVLKTNNALTLSEAEILSKQLGDVLSNQ